MYIIIWEYQVNPERVAEFESHYSANGAWAELFRKSPGYLGTELLRDQSQSNRFITIDRWTSSEAYNSFKTKWHDDYNALDALCDELTKQEALLGYFSSPS